MSTAQTTAAPVSVTPRMSPLRWIAGGTGAAALLAALAIAVWPASDADQARADGEQLGAAVNQLYAADSASEVDAALIEVNAAAADVADHSTDRVAEQVNDQADALSRAAEGFVGTHEYEDGSWESDMYQVELDIAVSDLEDNAEDFRGENPEVQQAFQEGYESGLAGE